MVTCIHMILIQNQNKVYNKCRKYKYMNVQWDNRILIQMMDRKRVQNFGIQPKYPIYNSRTPTSNPYASKQQTYHYAQYSRKQQNPHAYPKANDYYSGSYEKNYINNHNNYNNRLHNKQYPVASGLFETRSSTSKIGSMNERIARDTQMFKIRNQSISRQFDVRSRSTQMKRSRLSMGDRPSSKNYNGYKRPHKQMYKYNTDTQSMSSSRTNNQILSRPIISYDKQINPRQLILSSPQQYPSFKKQISPSFAQFQKFNGQQPILIREEVTRYQNPQNGYGVNTGSMFGNAAQQQVSYNQPSFKKLHSGDRHESYGEFYDMGNAKNTSMESIGFNYADFREQAEPVSPVNGFQNMKKISQKVQKQSIQTKISSPIQYSQYTQPYNQYQKASIPANNQTFPAQVTNMIRKVDAQGKIIIPILIILGVVLVLVQIAK